MAPQVSPAIVVGVGPIAEKITSRAQELIKLRNDFDCIPPIFQFLVVGEDKTAATDCIAQAYSAAVKKRAITATEESTGLKVLASRVESFIIAPLQPEQYDSTIQVAHALRECSKQTIGGGRNAIFLIPKSTLPDAARARQKMAEAIDAEVKGNLLFNRSFFIAEIDELGQTIGEDDLVELVARFVSLAVASELSSSLRTTPPPYLGDGLHYRGYASFSCSNIGFDATRLIDALSSYLARDICRQLFANTNSTLEEGKWLEQAQHWFAESLKQPLSEPLTPDLTDMNLDPDFILAKARLDDFTLSVCRSLFHNGEAFTRVLDGCMEQGMIELESQGNEIKKTKKEINELEIKIMLGIPCGRKAEPTSSTTKVRSWWLIITLAVLGLGTIVALLIITNGQLMEQKLLTAVGSVLIIAAAVLMIVGKTIETTGTAVTTISCRKELEKKQRLYKQQKKVQNIHLALFTYLDLAHANVEDLRSRTFERDIERTCSIFDLDLIDEELARNFYESQYETRDTDIASFVRGSHLQEIHQIMFSFFGTKIFDYLREYCNRCFEKIRGYDLEKVFRMRESLNGHRQLLPTFFPFWHPISSDSDRIVLALTSDDSSDMRTLLRNTFGDNNIHFVDGKDSAVTTLVQIAYGQELKSILTDSFSNPASEIGVKPAAP
jgi:hypothetical protein